MKNRIAKIYEEKYKKLLIIPFLLLVLAIIQIAAQTAITGDFVNRGVSLKGGVTLTVLESEFSPSQLERYLKGALAGGDVTVRSLSRTRGLVIDASDVEAEELLAAVEQKLGELSSEDYSLEIMGASLSESFFRETGYAMLLAFIFMGIVVFITFRTFIPSIAVILAALSDIVVTLAIYNITGLKLGTAGIAAFLMLIGYSVDTDILLSTRVLRRREGSVMERVYSAMKTGFMMNITTLAAITVALFIAQSDTIRQIMIILLIGILVDMVNTWIQNVGILRLYLEKKSGGKHG